MSGMPSKKLPELAETLKRVVQNSSAGSDQLLLTDAMLQLTTILDGLPCPVIIKDQNLRWVYANPAVCELYSIKDEYIGFCDQDLIDFNFATPCMLSDKRAIDSQKACKSEEKIISSNGEVKLFEITKMPCFDKQGNFSVLFCLFHDITNFVEQQKALQLSLAAQKQLVEHDALTGLYSRPFLKT